VDLYPQRTQKNQLIDHLGVVCVGLIGRSVEVHSAPLRLQEEAEAGNQWDVGCRRCRLP